MQRNQNLKFGCLGWCSLFYGTDSCFKNLNTELLYTIKAFETVWLPNGSVSISQSALLVVLFLSLLLS